jgi:hypothetical protein
MFGMGGGGSTRYRIAERKRLEAIRKREQQKAVWQTTEGEGIAEKADISLGYDDSLEDDDELEREQSAGLMI